MPSLSKCWWDRSGPTKTLRLPLLLTCHVYLDGVRAGALRVRDGAGHHHVEHLPGEAGDQEHGLLRRPEAGPA